jgi:hypothetical protein
MMLLTLQFRFVSLMLLSWNLGLWLNEDKSIFSHIPTQESFNILPATCNEMNNEVLELHANSPSLVFRRAQLTSVVKVLATERDCHRLGHCTVRYTHYESGEQACSETNEIY